MQINATTRLDRWPAMLAWAVGLVGAAVLALLLSRGTTGGDEGGVLQFLATFREGGWHALTGTPGNHDFLAHRLFWLGEKMVWEDFLRLVVPAKALAQPAIYAALMVLDDTLFMLAAFGLAVWHLRRRHGGKIALLAASALFIASSAIGMFAGGFSECLMTLFVVLMTMQLDRDSALKPAQLCVLVLAGLGLLASKVYAAPFVLVLALLLHARSQKIVVGALFLIGPFAWLILQSEVRSAAPSGMLNFYVALMPERGIATLLSDAVAFFFSLSFGLLPCFPTLLLTCFCGKARQRVLAIKIFALLGVSVTLLTIPFWSGPGGLAGPRYITPFLFVLLPEIAAGLERLARSRPRLLLLVPAAALLFLPCLEYRNSLVTRYARDTASLVEMSWPHAEIAMHPAVLAWSVVIAKLQHRQTLNLSSDMAITVPTQDIFPMTTLSRLIYVLSFEGPLPPQMQSVRTILSRYRMDNVWIWVQLRLGLAALLLGALTSIAARRRIS